MAITGKKNKDSDKSKKKLSTPSKGRSRPKVKDEVCVINDVVLTERVYCCDDECCCLM